MVLVRLIGPSAACVREVGNGAKKTQASLRAPVIWVSWWPADLALPLRAHISSGPVLEAFAIVQTIQTHAHGRGLAVLSADPPTASGLLPHPLQVTCLIPNAAFLPPKAAPSQSCSLPVHRLRVTHVFRQFV